jgi:hypothetical protein
MGLLQRVLHPAWYHGHGVAPPFFEGWYYKLVDATEAHRFAIIPGIFKSRDPAERHAFVQVLDGTASHATYHRYPAADFRAAEDALDIGIGANAFTYDGIALAIETPERSITGALQFEGLTPWPVTLLSPGVMGPFAWLPFLETYHGILSFDHQIQGTLQVDGREIDFSGGRGYMEKDWGPSFPAAWVWFQSNHFDGPGTSISASVALIPLPGTVFRGFIIGLWHDGELHRFATYTGARIEALSIEENEVRWVVRSRRERLEMRARRTEVGLLRGPNRTDMGVRVPETLQAEVAVRLSSLQGGETIFEGTGRNGGLEVAGEWEKLL